MVLGALWLLEVELLGHLWQLELEFDVDYFDYTDYFKAFLPEKQIRNQYL